MRRGFLPFLTREDETQMPLKKLPKRLVIIEPLVPMSKRVADELLQWLRDGGKVLVFASPTGGRNLEHLLKPLGLSVDQIPLGSGNADKAAMQLPIPNLADAWALKLTSDKHQSLVSRYGFPVSVAISVGKGKLILFSDPKWALNQSLESFYRYNKANVIFFKVLVQKLW
ncbi:MAG: DUF4350 domain-containing protein, partial [Armatimonadetes bacterium]|nr:DUF4350 domain-containing protein [Armatimonadota bacterium]